MSRLINDDDYLTFMTADSATDSLDRAISMSHGQPTMSPEDVKVALIMTQRALQYQMMLNAALIERIVTLEEKKKFFRRK